ncbi:MAG: prepilin-type N-terminal cleavage/methylation domain-containing protein [Syntrophales bacterium]
MSVMHGNNRGISLIEVVIAMFLTTVAVLAILSLQAPAWKTTARADYLGRAAEILHRQLETQEAFIMNQCNTVTTGGPTTSTVITSGQGASISGDATFTVNTTITSIGTNIWRVDVTVTWPPLNSTGIRGSVVVARQQFFKSGC